MIHPLLGDISHLTDSEVDLKLADLSRKYFQTHNPGVQTQIANLIDIYKEEIRTRRARAKLQQQEENGDNDLDNLIKVS